MAGRSARFVILAALIGAFSVTSVGAQTKGFKAPPGKMVIWAFGQPKFLQLQIDDYFQRNPSEVQGVTAEVVATKGEEEVRQKTMLAYASQTWDDMADVISTFPVSMQAMAEAGVLMDVTSYLAPFKDKFVAGAYDQALYKGRLWALPRSLRPQLLFYNRQILEKYGIDPKQMTTFEGYLEVGRKLKAASNGQVFLSYEDPGSRTWRYWGRRGLMPQAGARIWDDDGNVVIDKDAGALKALQYFETLHKEGLLFNSVILQPPLYQATREGKIATFYIGAFYDEFLKANDKDMAGAWRVMAPPVLLGCQPRRRSGCGHRGNHGQAQRPVCRALQEDMVRLQLQQPGPTGLYAGGPAPERPGAEPAVQGHAGGGVLEGA